MGKVYDRRAALGNHQRQRAQATMMLHGWRAFHNHDTNGAAAVSEANDQTVRKDAATGKASIWRAMAPLVGSGQFIEWDEVSTPRVLWLYKVMLREKMI